MHLQTRPSRTTLPRTHNHWTCDCIHLFPITQTQRVSHYTCCEVILSLCSHVNLPNLYFHGFHVLDSPVYAICWLPDRCSLFLTLLFGYLHITCISFGQKMIFLYSIFQLILIKSLQKNSLHTIYFSCIFII